MTTTITGKNQVTLPAELVRELGWKPGTRLDWKKGSGKSVVVCPQPTRGESLRKARGLGRASARFNAVNELQRMQEEEDETF